MVTEECSSRHENGLFLELLDGIMSRVYADDESCVNAPKHACIYAVRCHSSQTHAGVICRHYYCADGVEASVADARFSSS